MVFVKNSDEGVFSPHFTAKSIVRWRSYPSSVGYAATFSPGGEGFCYLQKVFSLHTRFGFIDTLKGPCLYWHGPFLCAY